MTESALQSHVLDLGSLYGWRRVHFRPALTSKGYRTAYTGDDGFPDVVMARNGCTVIAELKNACNSASEAQWEWLASLAGGTVEEFKRLHKRSEFGGCVVNKTVLVALWRPKHLDVIEDILRTWVEPGVKPKRSRQRVATD